MTSNFFLTENTQIKSSFRRYSFVLLKKDYSNQLYPYSGEFDPSYKYLTAGKEFRVLRSGLSRFYFNEADFVISNENTEWCKLEVDDK